MLIFIYWLTVLSSESLPTSSVTGDPVYEAQSSVVTVIAGISLCQGLWVCDFCGYDLSMNENFLQSGNHEMIWTQKIKMLEENIFFISENMMKMSRKLNLKPCRNIQIYKELLKGFYSKALQYMISKLVQIMDFKFTYMSHIISKMGYISLFKN